MIEQLQLLSNQILAQKVPEYKRFLFDKIDFNERLIGVLGSRGVGKTTLLLQYLHSIFKEKKTENLKYQILNVIYGNVLNIK